MCVTDVRTSEHYMVGGRGCGCVCVVARVFIACVYGCMCMYGTGGCKCVTDVCTCVYSRWMGVLCVSYICTHIVCNMCVCT
jgi:Na+/proline symporter